MCYLDRNPISLIIVHLFSTKTTQFTALCEDLVKRGNVMSSERESLVRTMCLVLAFDGSHIFIIIDTHNPYPMSILPLLSAAFS